ncbi:hypothetical protein GobsT_67390 [Gemmata obscuriglobus]|uniref:Uncharacterized protein n=1 Tax=Gemmata obscuriglobus TaxID=114 RepID=A0A2Z3GW38_9BACT|nr:hypothetical protein [Gemmata obscuriglobus]AWM35586.1 hypothetical protein C1280_00145 [Gemmata obscuriglobus]QEG31892.1 hypothetical protein GobsT_67390 [Gemmata obscuriglobus]VTS11238.1 unnamed protein product [Gemmata obscuriglobus UQM 2246]
MESVFNKNPGYRPEAEWRRMLGGLVESLSAHTGIRFAPTSWFIEDHPGYANSGGCVDVRGPVSPALRLEACGVVCISVNHGQAASASAAVLLFSGGRRVLGPDAQEVVVFRYTPNGWVDHGWVCGECGEWEKGQYPTDARWQRAEPDTAG